jgi:hypothetical protein
MSRVYVGDFNSAPKDVNILPDEFHKIHPRDFKKTKFPEVFFTNNPCVVDCFLASSVYCCHNGRIKQLSEHENFQRWNGEFISGEFWTMVGEDWV